MDLLAQIADCPDVAAILGPHDVNDDEWSASDCSDSDCSNLLSPPARRHLRPKPAAPPPPPSEPRPHERVAGLSRSLSEVMSKSMTLERNDGPAAASVDLIASAVRARAAAMRAAAQLTARLEASECERQRLEYALTGHLSRPSGYRASRELVEALGDYDATLQAANRECVRLRNTVEGQLRELDAHRAHEMSALNRDKTVERELARARARRGGRARARRGRRRAVRARRRARGRARGA